MGDYFQEGLPQDHDNDDGNSNIANEAEDHVNMGICAIHNYNFNKIEWNSGHMLKWLCTNDGRCYMMKCNICAYNK